MKTKQKLVMPTDAEDREINRGIAEDPDTMEITAEHYKKARPVSELIKNQGGRPKLARPKMPVTSAMTQMSWMTTGRAATAGRRV